MLLKFQNGRAGKKILGQDLDFFNIFFETGYYILRMYYIPWYSLRGDTEKNYILVYLTDPDCVHLRNILYIYIYSKLYPGLFLDGFEKGRVYTFLSYTTVRSSLRDENNILIIILPLTAPDYFNMML